MLRQTPSFQFSSFFFCSLQWYRNTSVAFSPKHITSDSSSSHQTVEESEGSSNRKIGFISSLHTQGTFPLLSSYFKTLTPDPYGNVGVVRVKCYYFLFTEDENKVQRERERVLQDSRSILRPVLLFPYHTRTLWPPRSLEQQMVSNTSYSSRPGSDGVSSRLSSHTT